MTSSIGMMKFPIYGKMFKMFQTTNQFWSNWLESAEWPTTTGISKGSRYFPLAIRSGNLKADFPDLHLQNQILPKTHPCLDSQRIRNNNRTGSKNAVHSCDWKPNKLETESVGSQNLKCWPTEIPRIELESYNEEFTYKVVPQDLLRCLKTHTYVFVPWWFMMVYGSRNIH